MAEHSLKYGRLTKIVTAVCWFLVIVVLYSSIFYRVDTISHDPDSAVVYIAWLGFSLFCLALIARQAMMLNRKARIHYDKSAIWHALPHTVIKAVCCFCARSM